MKPHPITRLVHSIPVPLIVCGFLAAACVAHSASAPLVADPPIVVPESKGGFDYLQVDAAQRRLLANHTGNNTLDVFDLDSGKLIKHIPTGKAQGVAVVAELGKYFVSVSREQIVAVIDSKTLEKTGEIKLAGPADSIVFHAKNHSVYVDHDDGAHVWVIDARTEKITATVDIPEGPEYILSDPESDRVFQNIKLSDALVVIDPATNTVRERWTTAPAKSPHGLALDPKTHRLFCAGANGKLAVIDSTSGKLITVVDIAAGVDQIAFDPDTKRVYCPSKNGVLSVVEETAEGATSLGDVKTAPGAKTIAIDPKTHAVWVAYADKEKSYILRLTAP